MKRILIAVAFLTGCSSIPRSQPSLGRCFANDYCVVLQIHNSSVYDATVWLNGLPVTRAPALGHTTSIVGASRLDGARCASIEVRLIDGRRFRSTRECVRLGQRLELAINALLSSSWLVPR
jgi:hypothetical protein